MSKYEEFSKEELVTLVEKQDNELASKKYGLVWDSEREPEQIVLDCEHNLPVLKRIKGKEIREPKNNELKDNILIEGDNYHALTVLNYTHQEKIDVIYIDPPYNTGNQDFKYNDKFVDKEDGFRHSKWLNFMEKRLNLAKDLLKETGVIFISIDDNEQAQLKMLCNKIFGEENFITQFIWRRSGTGGLRGVFPITTHEYILAYAKNKLKIKNKWFAPYSDDSRAAFKASDEGGEYKTQALYLTSLKYVNSQSYFINLPDGTVAKPPEGKGSWRYIESTYKDELEKGNILFKKVKSSPLILKNGSGAGYNIYTKQYISSDGTNPPSMLPDDIVGQTRAAKAELKGIFGSDVFDYAKPSSLIKYLINLVDTPGDAVVLDFFSGTGTTGAAVLQINKEIASKKSFILCTNNENKICEEVTYPRLQKVMNGYKKNGNGEKVTGLGGNLQYFKTDLVKHTKNKDQLRVDLTHRCTEMLCVKENIFNLGIEEEDYKIFSSNKGDRFLCVYYNLFDESFDDFLKEIKQLKGKKMVYMFSIDGRVEKKLFSGIKDCDIEEIPQKIVEVYRQLVKMNIPVKADTIFLEFEKANKKIFEDKEKDESARILRIVLEKTIQKIAQKNGVSIFKDNHKEEKIAVLNDQLKVGKVFTKVQWEENKTYLTIGNNASHGDYGEYTLKQVENFYRHTQSLLNDFGI